MPEGFTADQLVLTDEALDRAVSRTLTEMFEIGMVDDPYRDPEEAEAMVARQADWDEAAKVHRESVVLLKNDGTLPLTADKLAGKKVYAEAFHKDTRLSEQSTAKLRGLLEGVTLTEDPAEADYALLFLTPQSGAYFNATPSYLELDLCEGKTVHNVDEDGRPVAETHEETTVTGMGRIAERDAGLAARQPGKPERCPDRRFRHLPRSHPGRDAGPFCPGGQAAPDHAPRRRSAGCER